MLRGRPLKVPKFVDLCRERVTGVRRRVLGRPRRIRPIPWHLFRVGHYVFVGDKGEAVRTVIMLKGKYPLQVWRIFELAANPITATYAILRTH